MSKGADDIYIELPIDKEYAHLLRLLVAGVAGRMNFSIEMIDDLKMAVEEVFLMLINYCGGAEAKVSFKITDKHLEIVFEDTKMSVDDMEDKYRKHQNYGFFIIEALVDEFKFIKRDKGVDLRLLKKRV